MRGREIREKAGTTAGTNLAGGSCIYKGAKWGLGTVRLPVWVAA